MEVLFLHRCAESGDRCTEMSRSIEGIEKTFTLQSLSVCRGSLFVGFELVLVAVASKQLFYFSICFDRTLFFKIKHQLNM